MFVDVDAAKFPSCATTLHMSSSLLSEAAALLQRLTPADLVGDEPEVSALREVGCALFGRAVLQQRYGQQDVVEFLREQAGHREMLRRLEKLQRKINQEHERRVKDSRVAGINQARKATMEAIESAASSVSLLEVDGDAAAEAPAEAASAGALVASTPAASSGPPRLPPRARAIEVAVTNAAEGGSALGRAAQLPAGSFRRSCGVCKRAYDEVHAFYHRLCPECAEFNLSKRNQTASLAGYVALVTGGRVRIGYEIVLKLLRAGAHVLATTRFPSDAAARYAAEADFDAWRERLEIVGPLELADVRQVEAFCARLRSRFRRIHILVNNAAQTLTRDRGWFVRMAQLESGAAEALPPTGRALLTSSSGLLLAGGGAQGTGAVESEGGGGSADGALVVANGGGGAENGASGLEPLCGASLSAAELEAFPRGKLDETLQPLDLSRSNSWSRRLGEVTTPELLHTLAANAVAPFVLCSALRPLLSPTLAASASPVGSAADETFGHIINVSALEGKFSVGKKGSGHPHTNMSKAALNMLTCTSSGGLFQEKVLVNAVDTGWVTDMAPGGVGAVAATHETHVGPPLDAVDGAARVLDPVFSHVREPAKWLVRGKFWKDYSVASW